MVHTLADIDALIDRAARQRLQHAVVKAKYEPTPENIARLKEWPDDWVKQVEGMVGVPRDRRIPPPEQTAAAEKIGRARGLWEGLKKWIG